MRRNSSAYQKQSGKLKGLDAGAREERLAEEGGTRKLK